MLDPEGIRTIGVITKIDIMGEGSDASKILLNDEVKLKLGYIGVKNRSQQDIINKVPVQKALRTEEDFFSNDPRYSGIPSDILGTRALVEKLTSVLY
jgi:replication fork clamp-binding protein CrfC